GSPAGGDGVPRGAPRGIGADERLPSPHRGTAPAVRRGPVRAAAGPLAGRALSRPHAAWTRPLRWFGFAEFGLVPRLAGVALLLLTGIGGGWMLGLNYMEPPLEPPAVSFAKQAANAHLLYA